MADDVRTGQFATAAEWLLDSFHLVASETRDIHRHLPASYYRQLPTLASREQEGVGRVVEHYGLEVSRGSRTQDEQIAALDRRVPQVTCVDEVGIAQTAAELRLEAVERIERPEQ